MGAKHEIKEKSTQMIRVFCKSGKHGLKGRGHVFNTCQTVAPAPMGLGGGGAPPPLHFLKDPTKNQTFLSVFISELLWSKLKSHSDLVTIPQLFLQLTPLAWVAWPTLGICGVCQSLPHVPKYRYASIFSCFDKGRYPF